MMDIESLTVTTPGDRVIVMTRLFDAPRSVVFKAWTQPEHVAQWWDPSGTPLSVCEIDLRPKGMFRWVHAGGAAHEFSGTYQEITAPERLVFTVAMFPTRPAPLATLLFTEFGTKTKLTMTIACASTDDRDSLLQMRVDEGTSQTFRNLAQYLTKADLS